MAKRIRYYLRIKRATTAKEEMKIKEKKNCKTITFIVRPEMKTPSTAEQSGECNKHNA